MEPRVIHKAIQEICEEENIKLNKLSFGWIYQMSKEDKIRYLCGNNLDLNGEAAGKIAWDKYATYEILKSFAIPVAEHEILFNPTIGDKYEKEEGIFQNAISYFHSHGNKIVVKANNGSQGKQVYLCTNIYSLEKTIVSLFKQNTALCLCPFYEIEYEYRVFYIAGECMYTYRKVKPSIVGDGIKTIGELTETTQKDDTNDQAIDLNYIPKQGEKIETGWKFNLSGGAKPELVQDNALRQTLYDLATKAGRAANVNYASIDIIQEKTGELKVLEINSGVVMSKFVENVEGGYEIAKEIYRKAIVSMFLP